MITSSHSGHSAIVKMSLVMNGDSLPVAQMGPDFLLMDAAIDYPAGEAELVLCVDQSERRWKVRLPQGIAAASKRVPIELAYLV